MNLDSPAETPVRALAGASNAHLPVILPRLTQHGGHIGFVGGTLRTPHMWLEQRILQWLTPWLEN